MSDRASSAGASVVAELEGVGRAFGDTVAVRDCDLTIAAGSLLAITGTSGSGKSTLMNLLGLLDTPTSGRYVLDGHDPSDLGPKARARLRSDLIGFVYQAFHLLGDRSAAENVELSLRYSREPRRARAGLARDALDRVGLSHRFDARPTTLSGGEQQRVAIARALVRRPQLLLCDEPTGNLDSASSDRIFELLSEIHRAGTAVVIVTHDLSLAGRCDQRHTMVDGRLRAGSS